MRTTRECLSVPNFAFPRSCLGHKGRVIGLHTVCYRCGTVLDFHQLPPCAPCIRAKVLPLWLIFYLCFILMTDLICVNDQSDSGCPIGCPLRSCQSVVFFLLFLFLNLIKRTSIPGHAGSARCLLINVLGSEPG